jgi:hypothetical protein
MMSVFRGLMLGIALVALGGTTVLAEVRPVKMERVAVLPAGHLAFEAGLALEKDRERFGLEYDNVRLAPLGLRFGLGSNFEVGGFFAYSDNSRNDVGAPNRSGLEGLTLFGKVALNDAIAVQLGLTFFGKDNVFPYANDGLDLFINVPMQRPVGPGLLYGQVGYRVQDGDFDFNSYLNFGIGYGFPMTDQVAFSLELVGEESQPQKGIGNTLDLVFGANVALAQNLRLAPYVSLGLYDSSPDVAVGSFLEVRF